MFILDLCFYCRPKLQQRKKRGIEKRRKKMRKLEILNTTADYFLHLFTFRLTPHSFVESYKNFQQNFFKYLAVSVSTHPMTSHRSVSLHCGVYLKTLSKQKKKITVKLSKKKRTLNRQIREKYW